MVGWISAPGLSVRSFITLVWAYAVTPSAAAMMEKQNLNFIDYRK